MMLLNSVEMDVAEISIIGRKDGCNVMGWTLECGSRNN
jgi:hypothetical protein